MSKDFDSLAKQRQLPSARKWSTSRQFFKECGRQKVLLHVGGTEGLKQFVTVEELYAHFAARLNAEAGK